MKEGLREIVDNFRGKKILVIGDVMLDQSIYGHVERISPEASVPVLKEESREYMLGGAGNVAANISSLSGSPTLLGFIGKDIEGKKIEQLAEQVGISFLPSYQGSTIVKIRPVSIDHQPQQLLRIDREDISQKLFNFNFVLREAEKAELVIVSDYAKGAITPELIQVLNQLKKRVIVDPRPVNKNLYQNVFLITPNEREALEMAGCKDVHEAGKKLRGIAKNVIITRGKSGMSIFNQEYTENQGIRDIPTSAEEVYDVTGAGDTANAALGLALSSGASLEEAAILANHAAGIAVAHSGTYRVTLSELEAKLFQEAGKIKTLRELEKIVKIYHDRRKKVVWTNGCFDLLHVGHTNYLRETRAAGDCLIVGLNSDESVRKLKGKRRPYQPEQERAEILASLEFVDFVLIFPETSVERYLQILQPDIYAKGKDYSLETMNQSERKALESYGGKTIFIALTPGQSTTKIANKIKGSLT